MMNESFPMRRIINVASNFFQTAGGDNDCLPMSVDWKDASRGTSITAFLLNLQLSIQELLSKQVRVNVILCTGLNETF
jgi:hypothetical protein